ncbi:MAG TPA: tyrosine-type recombinase/integrase [Streptosporangiaceae bacterium]|nr:tyrosine-type recombinase/integrase [Streptosporangiaceae bacterium]
MTPDPAKSLPDNAARHAGRRSRPGARPAVLPGSVAGVFADYETYLAQTDGQLDANTVRVYTSRVRQYLIWLAAALETGTFGGDPITDPGVRDQAVRAYRTHLSVVAKRKPATINAHLIAVDDFYRRRGPGPAAAERLDVPRNAPRVLSERDQLRLLREADRAPLRDKAIAFTAFYAGTRVGETVGLDIGDIHLSARHAHLIVRRGRNGTYREIPLHRKLRTVLAEWIHDRATWKGAGDNPALFLNHRGGRLSTRSAYTVLSAIADAADLPVGRDGIFTPRVLRHTAATTMSRHGTDIALVAELLGHSAETARRYYQPNPQDRQKAIERLTTDE